MFREISKSRIRLSVNRSTLFQGDVLHAPSLIPSNSIQCVVTSPPYWALREFASRIVIGLNENFSVYIRKLALTFHEVKRVLRDDVILWLNMGDGYTSRNKKSRSSDSKNKKREMSIRPNNPDGLKEKELLGIPWRLAFALHEGGWYLRSDNIWNKPNAMPESVRDRPTIPQKYLFMLTKNAQYQYYYENAKKIGVNGKHRNRRSVLNVNTVPSKKNFHPAPFPETLVEPCKQASTKKGNIVLDPFCGSGTAGIVSRRMGRKFIGINIVPSYINSAKNRMGVKEDRIIKLSEETSIAALLGN
jgi:site-specific DNA-methyltransferase (cytosine-N4-specific)